MIVSKSLGIWHKTENSLLDNPLIDVHFCFLITCMPDELGKQLKCSLLWMGVISLGSSTKQYLGN